MRYLIFSDSHGNASNIKKAIDLHPEADGLIFLGDGVKEFKELAKNSNKQFYTVCGNCDIGSNEKLTDFIICDGHKIMICHGHRYYVKNGIYDLLDAAKSNGCDIVLYGHTHIPFSKYINEIHIMNPGTISLSPAPSYGLLDITDSGVLAHIVNLH